MDYTSCNPDGIRSLATDSPWSPLQSKINYAGANNRDMKLQLFRNVTTIPYEITLPESSFQFNNSLETGYTAKRAYLTIPPNPGAN